MEYDMRNFGILTDSQLWLALDQWLISELTLVESQLGFLMDQYYKSELTLNKPRIDK